MNAEQYLDETTELNGTAIHIISYKIGDEYHCHITNADPGATIARASGASREAARDAAVSKATQRLITKKV